jgi:dTDP-4-amino-4,6-dideoxygalactose transaminase
MNAKRTANSEYLHGELEKLNLAWMKLPTVKPHVKHSWFWYPLLIDEDMLGLTTLELRDFLQESGIGTRHRYVEPLYKQPALKPYGEHYEKLNLPNVEAIAGKMLGLPNHQGLKREELDYIIQTIAEIG